MPLLAYRILYPDQVRQLNGRLIAARFADETLPAPTFRVAIGKCQRATPMMACGWAIVPLSHVGAELLIEKAAIQLVHCLHCPAETGVSLTNSRLMGDQFSLTALILRVTSPGAAISNAPSNFVA